MTTKAVAKIEPEEQEAEVLAEETMTKREATALNKKIQGLATKVSDNAFELLSLLEQAATGNIHKALGFKSWTEWYSTNVQIDVSDKVERKMLATMMSGKGMSQRAIAVSLGVGQATVSRDLDGEGDSDESPGTTTGLDGKEYKRKDDDEPKIIDGEVVEEEPAPTKRAALPKAFDAAVTSVIDAVNELLDLTEDDRFAKASKSLATKLGDDISAVADGVIEVLDKLGIAYDPSAPEEDADEEAEAEAEEAEEDSTE
jgi:transposase